MVGVEEIELLYFEKMWGRAEPIHMLLVHAGKPYKFTGVSSEDWVVLRGSDAIGGKTALPICKVNGHWIAETKDILWRFGLVGGYINNTAKNNEIFDEWVERFTTARGNSMKFKNDTASLREAA